MCEHSSQVKDSVIVTVQHEPLAARSASPPGTVQAAHWREFFLWKSSRAPGVFLRLRISSGSRSFASHPSADGIAARGISPPAVGLCRWIAAGQRPAPYDFGLSPSVWFPDTPYVLYRIHAAAPCSDVDCRIRIVRDHAIRFWLREL